MYRFPELSYISWPSLSHEQPKQICYFSTVFFLLRTLLRGAALKLLNCFEIFMRGVTDEVRVLLLKQLMIKH